MSPSNKLTVVIPVKSTNASIFSDKGKGSAAPLSDSDDESSTVFAKMMKVERENLK